MAKGVLYGELPGFVEASSSHLGLKDTKEVDSPLKFVAATIPDKYVNEIKDLRYKTQPLDSNIKSLLRKRHKYKTSRNHRKRLTVAEKRKLRLFIIPSDHQKYHMYVPLHDLWADYITDFIRFDKLTSKSMEQAEERLLKADLHGSIITVDRSRCPSLVGLTGIVVQETRNTLRLITKQDALKTVPKQNSVFSIEIQGYQLTVYGNNFRYKSSERASHKFKSKHTIDL